MADLPERLVPKSRNVTYNVMDGEAVIINLTNGTYYSLSGVGGFVWELIEQGRSLDEIAGRVAAAWDVPADRAGEDVRALAARLMAEDLVRETEEGADGAAGDDPEIPSEAAPYATPTLNVYNDMQEMFALDPPMPGLFEMPPDDDS